MRLRDIKIGDSYYYWGSEWVAEGIEEVDKAAGIWQSTVICRATMTGDIRKIGPRYLISWAEHLAAMRMHELEAQEMAEKVERFRVAVGEGTYLDGKINSTWVTIRFTEAAAERLLDKCGAKPLPENRRPSKVRKSDADEYMRRCALLGGRVRRALGAGYSSRYSGSTLAREGGGYQAQVSFYGDEIDQALAKLGVCEQTEDASALGELLV